MKKLVTFELDAKVVWAFPRSRFLVLLEEVGDGMHNTSVITKWNLLATNLFPSKKIIIISDQDIDCYYSCSSRLKIMHPRKPPLQLFWKWTKPICEPRTQGDAPTVRFCYDKDTSYSYASWFTCIIPWSYPGIVLSFACSHALLSVVEEELLLWEKINPRPARGNWLMQFSRLCLQYIWICLSCFSLLANFKLLIIGKQFLGVVAIQKCWIWIGEKRNSE